MFLVEDIIYPCDKSQRTPHMVYEDTIIENIVVMKFALISYTLIYNTSMSPFIVVPIQPQFEVSIYRRKTRCSQGIFVQYYAE